MEARCAGTLDFGILPSADDLKNERSRAKNMVPCPVCGGSMFRTSKMCWDCALELKAKRLEVERFMAPVRGLENQLARFRARVAREKAAMAEWRAEFERSKGDE